MITANSARTRVVNGATLSTSSSTAGRITSRNSSFCLMLEQISSPGGVLSISTSEYDQKQCASRQTISTTSSSTTDRASSNRRGRLGGRAPGDVWAVGGRTRWRAVSAAVTATSQADRWTVVKSMNGSSRHKLGDLWRSFSNRSSTSPVNCIGMITLNTAPMHWFVNWHAAMFYHIIRYCILGDTADERFRLLWSMLLLVLPFRGLSICLCFCLYTCHVRALCSNGKRYRQDFFYIRQHAISLTDRVKSWLTSVNPFFPKFCPNWPTPINLSVGDIRWQIAAEPVRDNAMITIKSQYRKLQSLFQMVPSQTHYDLHPPNYCPRFFALLSSCIMLGQRRWRPQKKSMTATGHMEDYDGHKHDGTKS